MILQRFGNDGICLGTLFERAAERYPANSVILDHDLHIAPELGRRPTVTEIADLIADHAAGLAEAAVLPGDYVVVHKSDGFDITLLACIICRAGAIPVLLSPKLDGATVAELMERVGRPHLVTDQAKLVNSLPDVVFERAATVLLASGEYERAAPLRRRNAGAHWQAITQPADRPTLITHTSGTTGTPKLAVHTGRTLQARYRPQAAVVGLVSSREPLAIHVSFVHSRMFTAMPIGLLQGHQLIILADDEPTTVREVFRRSPPGIIEAHPNSFMRWEVLADDPARPLGNVKYFSSTFDAIHPRTIHCMLGASDRQRARFVQMYGQSEVGPIAGRTYADHRGPAADGRCVGFPFPGMTDVRVVPRDGRRPSASNPGDIEVRSDGRIVTYLGEHDRWAKQVDDGWWRMGDVGYRTRWGCLHLLDRAVDQIQGIDSTLALEDALFARLDDLVEVILVPNRAGEPVPVVCTRDDKPLDRRAWATAVVGMPTMAEPVQWRHDQLPQTATTKIKRIELARRLDAGPDTGAR